MGIIKDLVDALKDVKDASVEFDNEFKVPKRDSLSKMAQKGTLQFPVIVSSSLDLETSSMITKSLEKHYASFVYVSLTMNPMIKDTDSMQDHISKFHQNIDATTPDGYVYNKASDALRESSVTEKICFIDGEFKEGHDSHIHKDNIKLLKDPMSDLNLDRVNDKAKSNPGFTVNSRLVSDEFFEKYGEKEKVSLLKEDYSLPKDSLKWSQVNKLNELMPTMLTIKVWRQAPGAPAIAQEFAIGVKTTLHMVNSEEMVDNMVDASENKGQIFRFIKWTTGEISFLKDFIFNMNEIKKDVTNKSKGHSRWWITLKRRGAVSRIKSWFSKKALLPNSTIVINMEEVDFIKSQHGHDLMNEKFVNNIMETYFLLGFIIVDNSSQIAHFMFDGQTSFASHSFKALEKEGESKNDLKDMLKLVNRVY